MERIYEIILEFGSEKTSYVSKTGSSDLGSELSKAKSTNPSSDKFVVDVSSFDGNKTNDNVTIDVKAKTPEEAKKTINDKVQSNVELKNLQDKGKLKASVTYEGVVSKEETLKKLQEHKVGVMSKKTLKKFLEIS